MFAEHEVTLACMLVMHIKVCDCVSVVTFHTHTLHVSVSQHVCTYSYHTCVCVRACMCESRCVIFSTRCVPSL